ncbi:uncharacterized protein LOC100882212 isoform X2 [Megachile rotundata]|uniref:uncharacterized protein LOC100882212 isoform X2 n=1 Tax=Megachile rotundata TaxID=143995 RepID=UPI003FD37B12
MKRKEQKKQNKNASIRSKQLEARGVSMDMETSWAAQEMTSTFSDLNHMARFQQKQLQEKEQKLLQLYDQQQQRAYQVVQRGSAGSNGSNHGSSINQHTVTKTTTTSHTTSTSHGGKVRQMFDERRQTTVKGIDRSYPLEPLENKPRKQTNGNVAQKNGNLTVNRQSVTVKRVARADVNSNLNGGKPIVSYHEEITRESYGPAGRQQSDDDEFGNENHINQYANGNQAHIEEALDEDTIERNRMMAKLHLMEYDDTLKHRVKNDLESEEFPSEYMVDVPDKLPKRSVTKKLSQAEARLERFKNANAKRSNSITKNPGTVLKKRSDPILPAKSTSSEHRGKTRTRQIFDRGSTRRGSHVQNVKCVSLENVDKLSPSRNLKDEDNRVYYKEGEMLMSSEIDEMRTRGRSESPKVFREESTKSAKDAKYREKLSPEFSKNIRRSESPSFDSNTAGKSTDLLFLRDRAKRSGSPKFFCEESEKSATTYAIDSRTREKFSPEFSKNIKKRSESPNIMEKSQEFSKDIKKRCESPKYFCKESEKSATTYAIDARTREKFSPEFSRNIKKRSESPNTVEKSPQFSKDIKKRSESPKFFCEESEKSATTYAIDSRTREKLSPEFSRDMKQRKSPKTVDRLASLFSKDIRKRSESPKYFCEESEKSATTYAIDSKTRDKLSPEFSKDTKHGKSKKSFDSEASKKSTYELLKDRIKRSGSPKYFCREPEKSATTYALDSKTRGKLSPENSKNVQRRSDSPDTTEMFPQLSKNVKKRSDSPKFFCEESEKSATTYAIDSRTREKFSPDFSRNIKKRSESPNTMEKSPQFSKDIKKRSVSPKFFCKESEKSATTYAIDSKTREKLSPDFSTNIQRRSESPVMQNLSQISKNIVKRSESPKYFCKESEKSATTYAIASKTREELSPEFSKDIKKRSESPRSYFKESEKLARTIDSKSARQSSKSQMKDKRSESPKYFCRETEKSATTYAIDTRSRSTTPDFIKIEVHRKNMSPRNYPRIETEVDKKSTSKMPNVFERLTRERSASPKVQTSTRIIKSSKSPDYKKVPQKRNESPETKTKSPSMKKLDGRSSTSPQFFGSDSERSATIMVVTPETILKKKPESKKQYSKTYEAIIGPKRTMSEEIVDASSKQSIRSSVSRFFTEQCEKASRKLEAGKENSVQSAVTDKNRWSRDSSPLSLKDMRASPQFSGKPISATSIDSVRDWSPKSRRNSISPEPGNRVKPKSSDSMRSKQVFVKKSKSDTVKAANKMADRVVGNVLRSTRLIRDAINQSNRSYGDDVNRCENKYGVDKNAVKTVDSGLKLEMEDGKDEMQVERSRTPSRMFKFPAAESSPKSSTSMEVDAEIQEITMSDQYIEPREVRSKSRDKTPDCGRSSTKKLFTYSVRKPARKRSLFDSNVFELSKKDQGKTDRRETSGRKERVSDTLKSRRSPSADSLTFRDSKCAAEENENTKSTMEDLRVKGEYDHFEGTKRNWSSLSSDLTFHSSKSPIEENEAIRKVESGSRSSEIKVLDESRRRKGDGTQRNWETPSLTSRGDKPIKKSEVNRKTEIRGLSPEKKVREYQIKKDNFKRGERNWSNSPSPTNMTFRGFRRSSEEIKIKTGVSRSPEGIVDKEHLSSSPSPTNSSFRDSKPELNKNMKMKQEIKVEISQQRVPDKRNERIGNFERRQRSWSSSPSPTSNLVRDSKNITKKDKATFQSRERKTNVNRSKKVERKHSIRSKSSDSIKRRVSESSVNRRNEIREKAVSSKSPEMSKDSQILRSMELVRRIIKGGVLQQEETIKTAISDETVRNKETEVKKSDSARTMKIETRKSSSTIVYLNDESSSSKNYERTDSVESALRRFDSIGTESVQSITEKRQTVEESRNDSKAISLKALDQIDANLPQSLMNESLKRTSVSGKTNKNEFETRRQRKSAKTKDSMEVVRIVGSKSPTCKRKLFPDDEEAASGKSRHSGSKISEKASEKSDSKIGSRCLETFEGDTLRNETREVSTGVSPSLSVKQLRSIEDIRKSIDSLERTSKSAIANETLKRSDAAQSKRLASRRTDVGNKKEMILPGRSENFTAKKDALGDQERSSIKCAMRFSRVTKSPSPDSTKTTESSSRARRNVLTSPSKSPDTAARRPSTELKAQEARSTKRPTLMKGTEPIGNRKTATSTSTSTRKSTDVVDGAILENGVHLRDQTAETKYDNDSSATKKSDAFVIDFDEQPPKENDAPVPRKSLLRKHSTDKQIPSTQAGRPPSSVSSISSGSSMPIQVSGSKGKMASKTKTPSASSHRGSASSKSGGCAVVADSLVPCKMCGRRFASDRVALHEQICTKTTQKKRKQFDTMMYRVKGTDLEPFVKKGLCKKQPEKPEPKSNWRRKHEDFINAIRSAKQVQAHLAAGGKLSDLPPPPASDTSDYIQCPHCGRKFNQSAAERHIPKCEHMLHNKPVHSRAPKPKR